MSTLFRAELANLQRLINAQAAARHEENERARIETQKRLQRLHEKTTRTAITNRAAVLAWVKRNATSDLAAASANKVAEALGLKDDTTRKYLHAMAEEGTLQSRRTRGGQTRYYWKPQQ